MTTLDYLMSIAGLSALITLPLCWLLFCFTYPHYDLPTARDVRKWREKEWVITGCLWAVMIVFGITGFLWGAA